MAIIPSTQYPGKTNAPDADYPQGSARNITLPGDGTGTPWEAAIVNDILGFQQAILDAAGIVPTGNPDTVPASQYMQALSVLGLRHAAILADALTLKNVVAGKTAVAIAEYTAGQGGGAVWDFVLTSSVTPNGNNIVITTEDALITVVKRDVNEDVDILGNGNERLRRGANGAVVFIFDDNRRTTFDNGFPIFESQGEVANMALIADRFEEREPWDSANAGLFDWLKVQDAGWEACCHGYELATVFDASLDLALGNFELEQQFDLLNRNGFKAKQFVAPSSVLDSKFLPKVKELFSAAHIGVSTSDPATATDTNGNDAYNLRRVSLEEDITTTGLFDALVEYVKANNTLAIVYAHEVDGSFGSTPLTSARLNSAIDKCQAEGVPILTVSDALQRFNTNTIRNEFLGGTDAVDLESFKVKHLNLAINSTFHSDATSWVFATGTVGATNRVDDANVAGQFVFEIGGGAGSGTTQLSQIVQFPTSKSPLPIFASVVAGAISGTLDGQDLIIDIVYRRQGAPIAGGTKTITFPLTDVLTKYELSDFIKQDTLAEEIQLVIKVANNNPGQAVDIAIMTPSIGFNDGPWHANDNKTYVRSRRTTTQGGVTSAGAVVAFATTAKDYLGEYDNAGTFTVSRSGTLHINAGVMINDLGFGYDMTKLLLDIRKNGTPVVRGSTLIAIDRAVAAGPSIVGDRFGEPEVAVSAAIDVVAGDTIDIFLSHNGTTTMIIDPNDNATWLTISG